MPCWHMPWPHCCHLDLRPIGKGLVCSPKPLEIGLFEAQNHANTWRFRGFRAPPAPPMRSVRLESKLASFGGQVRFAGEAEEAEALRQAAPAAIAAGMAPRGSQNRRFACSLELLSEGRGNLLKVFGLESRILELRVWQVKAPECWQSLCSSLAGWRKLDKCSRKAPLQVLGCFLTMFIDMAVVGHDHLDPPQRLACEHRRL